MASGQQEAEDGSPEIGGSQSQQQPPQQQQQNGAPLGDRKKESQLEYQRLNKSFTDVTFIVGPAQHSKKYVGHRVLLAMTSPVFETMFYGDMADKNKYIRIVDVAPIGFENLLRFAYTDSLKLGSVEDAMLTAYAAKKYLLPPLLRECLAYIELNINPANACVVYEFAHVLNSQQLVLQAMNLIDRHTCKVLASGSFRHAQGSTVQFLANRKYLELNGSEYTLMRGVLSWTLSELKRRGGSGSDWVAVRELMNQYSIFSGLRFLALAPSEFAQLVAATTSNNKLELVADGLVNEDRLLSSSAQLDLDSPNSFLTTREQCAILLNLIEPNLARLPSTINSSVSSRQAPPDYFTLVRFKTFEEYQLTTATTLRSIGSIGSKFKCLNENIFIVALTLPIRLDPASFTNSTPKFECHLKFTTKSSSSLGNLNSLGSPTPASSSTTTNNNNQQDCWSAGPPGPTDTVGSEGHPLLMDTIDEALQISIARDKDCLVRLKRPILIRAGNVNELTLTLQTYALDEDIITLQSSKLRLASSSEQLDKENISWLFYRGSHVEFSELHYYY